MAILTQTNNYLTRKQDSETLMIEPWGENSLRVRITRRKDFLWNNWALLTVKQSDSPQIIIEGQTASIKNGSIEARINKEGWLSFYNDKDILLLEEYWRNVQDFGRYTCPLNISARELKPVPGTDNYTASLRFEAKEGEKIYGLGQYQDPFLDKKGSSLELAHRNSQSSVPFAVSNLGYGFLWNNPAVGRVSFARNITEWHADSTQEIDYWITAGDTPAQITGQYASVTGTVPVMPEYGLGFIQCKLRYRSQKELLDVARKYHELGLPLKVIAADFFHWPLQGDFRFDPLEWPDVEGMVKELNSYGIELMVSIWPTVDARSENRQECDEKGLLITADRGLRINMNWMGETVFLDFTKPETREFVWSKVKNNYFDKGIKIFWLDEAEPEFGIYDFDIYRYHAGPALQVGNIYPSMYAKAFYDGMKNAGIDNPLNLIRTAWAGSQRYGALVWSGDIHSSFRSLREQIAAGLSMGMAGIPWWTSDIGGFFGGNPDNEEFRELIIRWFQWGCFCPVFRLHGDRLPHRHPEIKYREGVRQFGSGADNEVWSFGEEAFSILKKYIFIRERLKPYIRRLMDEAHQNGTPVIRPLFYMFPHDQRSWEIETQYMFGPDLLVAPVCELKERKKSIYFPEGSFWIYAWTGERYEGGTEAIVEAPLDKIPLFLRNGADLPVNE